MVNGVAVPSWFSQSHLPCQSRTGVERIYAERDDQSKPFGLLHMLMDPPMTAGRPRAAQLDDVDGTMPHIRIRRATQLTVMAASSGPS